MADWIRREPRTSATVIQTVGAKGYDGFLLSREKIGQPQNMRTIDLRICR